MADLVFLALVAVFFAAAVLYVRACGALAPEEPLPDDGGRGAAHGGSLR